MFHPQYQVPDSDCGSQAPGPVSAFGSRLTTPSGVALGLVSAPSPYIPARVGSGVAPGTHFQVDGSWYQVPVFCWPSGFHAGLVSVVVPYCWTAAGEGVAPGTQTKLPLDCWTQAPAGVGEAAFGWVGAATGFGGVLP